MGHNSRLAWILTFCSAVSAAGLAQQPPAPVPRGVISGTVVDGSTGEALAGALVYLSGADLRPLQSSGQTRQVTDARGRFAFVNLDGQSVYTISASKFGYLDGGYGQDQAATDPLRPVALKNDEWISNLKVTLWRAGSISGSVRDEAGDPVVGVYVRVLARFRIQGRDDLAVGPLTTTDDRGEYRLSGLAPGRYVVQVPSVQASVPSLTQLPAVTGNATAGAVEVDDTNRLVIGRYPLPPPPVNGRQMAYPVIFHPSSPAMAQATFIDLKFGDERANVDLTLTPVPSVRVSGVVEGPPDAFKQLTVRLLPAGLENLGFGAEVATALVGGDGRFTFLNVPAGTYTIDAPVRVRELTTMSSSINRPLLQRIPVPPPAQGSGYSSSSIDLIPGLQLMDTTFRSGAAEFSGRAPITVGTADMSGVVVRLRPHVTMSGRVIVETDPSKTAKPPASVSIRLDPASGEVALGTPQRNFQQQGPPDTFMISGIVPGHYYVRTVASAWIPKSITWKGRDYTHVPMDLTTGDDFSGVTVAVTNATPELFGSVLSPGNTQADRSVVVAFPVERAQWMNTGLNPARAKSTPVSSSGVYRFTTLPAGDYYIAAIDRSWLTAWRETEFLAKLERLASRVSLTWGATTSQDLTTVTVR